jgi:hypothetical protein
MHRSWEKMQEEEKRNTENIANKQPVFIFAKP